MTPASVSKELYDLAALTATKAADIEDRHDTWQSFAILLFFCFVPAAVSAFITKPGWATEYITVRAESQCREGVLSEHIWPDGKVVCVYQQAAHGSVVKMQSPKNGDYLIAGFLDHPLGRK